MKEEFLHYIWKHRKFDASRACTTAGEAVSVIYPGEYLQMSGPDFFNAQIIIGTQRWAGNVEIHLKSSDWYIHRHEIDPAYENVVLHVVWEHDIGIFRKDNSELPVMELKPIVSSADVSNYARLIDNRAWIFCERQIKGIDPLTLANWLDRLFLERLEKKTEPILNLLNQVDNDWEAVLFVMLAKAFGLNTNGTCFMELALSIPFNVIRRESTEVENLEALLLHQAGLIDERPDDTYQSALFQRKEFLFAKHKLEDTSIPKPEFFKLRPDNFPTIRLAQLAMLYHQRANLFSELISISKPDAFYQMLQTNVSPYWQQHYLFGKSHPPRKKITSRSFIDLLIINTVVPLQFAYWQFVGRDVGTRMIDIMIGLKPETNAIIQKFSEIGIDCGNALESQALLQLKNEYCAKSRCLQCNIGLSLLQRMDSS